MRLREPQPKASADAVHSLVSGLARSLLLGGDAVMAEGDVTEILYLVDARMKGQRLTDQQAREFAEVSAVRLAERSIQAELLSKPWQVRVRVTYQTPDGKIETVTAPSRGGG
jgi:hypothetical protein